MNRAADRSRKAGMEENVKAVFISNYINHHQIPFCNACYDRLKEDFCFVQAQPMEQERLAMGWHNEADSLPFVKCLYEEEATLSGPRRVPISSSAPTGRIWCRRDLGAESL